MISQEGYGMEVRAISHYLLIEKSYMIWRPNRDLKKAA